MLLPALPIRDCLPALKAALENQPNAVLVAPPGAGKTTVVPLALLDAPWRGDGRIVMLEPRRLAARAAATRMSSFLGEPAGQTVGYRTRLDSAVSDATQIEVVTEGLLARRLQRDPGLEGVASVIFDEVHERGLDADLALAFCLDLQRGLRPELRLLAMSATADGARLSTLLDAPVIESAGRMFPVETHHATRDIASARDLPEAAARAIRAALAAHDGDILVFLPGMGEIRRTEQALAGCGALVLPLHGELPPAEQDRALRPAEGRRVVLSTSIAETSLTVPGVRIVVDGGFRRTPRLDPATGLSRLETVRISRAAAEQRAGRAGREAPGVAIRLWTAALHRGLAPFDRPEIFDAELSGLALDCAAWGAAPSALPFPDSPPAGALAAGIALLEKLRALGADGRITDTGRRMAQLGAHPRLAAMMLAAGGAEEAAMAAELAALLEERDPLRHTADADIGLRLAAISHGAGGRRIAAPCPASGRQRDNISAGLAHAWARMEIQGHCWPQLSPTASPNGAASRAPSGSRAAAGRGLDRPTSWPLRRYWSSRRLEQKASAQIRLAARLDPENLPPAIAAQVTEDDRERVRPGERRRVLPPPPAVWRAGAGGSDGARRSGTRWPPHWQGVFAAKTRSASLD